MSTINLFNSIYMVNGISQISEKHPSNFSILNIDLPFDVKKGICACCLCRASREKFCIPNDPFCILNDSLGHDCLKNDIECDANQLNSNALCQNCMQVVSLTPSKKDRFTKLFQCCVPSRKFESKRSFNMKRHYLVHFNVKENECAICERNFARKSDLQKHQRKCLKTQLFCDQLHE